jgi:hypothetical protein
MSKQKNPRKRGESSSAGAESGCTDGSDHAKADPEYQVKIGAVFLSLASCDPTERCRALANTDWSALDANDVLSLLLPLAQDEEPEVRQLVAVQLRRLLSDGRMGDLADARRLRRAARVLELLAKDPREDVRAFAGFKGVSEKPALTGDVESATSIALVEDLHWEDLEDGGRVFSFRCRSADAAHRVTAELLGLTSRSMDSSAKSQQDIHLPPVQTGTSSDAGERLPDPPLLDEGMGVPFDLPRPGTPVEVEVREGAERLPDPLPE